MPPVTPSGTTNPPAPLDPSSSPVTHGTILHYGLENLAVTGILIDSYRRDTSYAATDEVIDQSGKVVGIRQNDFRANVNIDGRVLVADAGATVPSYTVKPGDTLTINGDTILLQSVSYNGQARGFHTLSMSGTAYEGVVGIRPFGM